MAIAQRLGGRGIAASASARGAAALVGAAAFLLWAAAPALAQPTWRIDSVADTTAAPGGTLQYQVQVTNVGSSPTDGTPITVVVTLPSGLTRIEASGTGEPPNDWSCPGSPGDVVITCTNTEVMDPSQPATRHSQLTVTAAVDPSPPSSLLVSSFAVSGGDPSDPSATTVDPTRIAPSAPGFGIDAFDQRVAADEGGDPSTRAGGLPYAISTSIDFNTVTDPNPLLGALWPVEPTRDVIADLPPGFVGNPTVADRCFAPDLANSNSIHAEPLCGPASQVGTAMVHINGFGAGGNVLGPIPVFDMVPPPGVPARFGFNAFGTIVMLDARLRSASDYGLSVEVSNIPEGLPVAGTAVTFWGTSGSDSHDAERACAGEVAPWESGPSCGLSPPFRPFLRNPTSCTEAGLPWSLHVDSWDHPGTSDADGNPDLTDPAWQSATIASHEAPGYPYPESQWGGEAGIEGCEKVPFEPELSVQPTTNQADSPSGLNVDLSVPQDCWESKETIEEIEGEPPCQSDLEDATVTLPAGMTVNPSAAGGLASCSPTQVGLKTPVGQTPAHFSGLPASCPDAAKIGKAEIHTPLLDHPINGSVFLAQQGQNPFGSLLAVYLVFEDPQSGVIVKQAGRISPGPGGQLTTTFEEAPQLPFSELHLELFGGSRAALRTPSSCGTYTTTAQLTPWSHEGTAGEAGTPIAQPSSSFQITGCGGAFAPKLSAGTTNPLAGAFSPFVLRLSREDGSQELGGLSAKLPEGLLASLKGIPYCPDSALDSLPTEASGEPLLGSGRAQEASPPCPAASRVGTVTVGAGAGATPFYTTAGRAYLAGPYKGAPLSLAVIAPAVAGPFDLGSVLVRNALRIDPQSAQASAVSDPFPQILHGIPLDLRDVRVQLSKPGFTLNPTSCDPMAIDVSVSSASGAAANLSNRFQAAGCERLGFKPKLSLRLKGKTKRTGFPALHAVYRPKAGNANLKGLVLRFPRSEFIEQGHFRTICTRVQFAAGAGGGSQCPKGSVYGHIRATTPLLDKPLEGPVYLRSSNHKLPDVVFDLNGQIHLDVPVRIDSVKGGLRASIESAPDAPITKVTLGMRGGQKGLFVNSRDICAHSYRASVKSEAHNAKTHDFHPPLRAKCAKRSHRHGHHRHR